MSNIERPSWDSSTTCIQIVRDRMASLGWGTYVAEKTTKDSFEVVENPEVLDRRPPDFGVGWWR